MNYELRNQESWDDHLRWSHHFDLYFGTTEEDSRIKNVFNDGLIIGTGKRTFEYSFGLDDAIEKLRDFCFYLDKYSERSYSRYSGVLEMPHLEKDELTFSCGLAQYSAEMRAGGERSIEHFSTLLKSVRKDIDEFNLILPSIERKFEEDKRLHYAKTIFLCEGISVPREIIHIKRLLTEMDSINGIFQQIIDETKRKEIPNIIQIDPRCPELGLTWLTDHQEFRGKFSHYCTCEDCDINVNRNNDNLGYHANLFDSLIVLPQKIDPKYIRKVIRPLRVTREGYDWKE